MALGLVDGDVSVSYVDIPLFDRHRPSLRPDLPSVERRAQGWSGMAFRPPPQAARSVLDDPEHGAEPATGRDEPMIVSAGHALLFAVGAVAAAAWGQKGEASQSVSRPAGGIPAVPDAQRDRFAYRPHGNDPASSLADEYGWRFPPHAGANASSPQRKSAPSRHMRCRITASLRATATRARAMPRVLAIFMPQARRLDHFRQRTSRACAAS